MTEFYIDVSHYDWDRFGGNLDWAQLKETGVSVVFIRASYGDPLVYNPSTRHFEEMALRAGEAGLKVGGYHNLIHGDFASIKRQVDYFREQLDNVGAEFAMVDIEPYEALKANDLWPRLSDGELFAQEFKNQDTRRNLAVYLARWVWSGWLGSADLRPLMSTAGGPLINANYPLKAQTGPYKELYVAANGDTGPGWTAYGNVNPEIWQYSSNAIVPGASPVTDVNAFRGSADVLIDRLTRKDSQVSLIATVLWPGMKALSPTSRLGGIYADKRGYHNRRNNLPSDDYSVEQFAVDREGPADEAAAIDWTFPSAQAGNYAEISKYSKRLYAARLDADNSRTKYIREFFGQNDSDSTVEGWDYSKDRAASSDSSHLWHIHISIHRKYVNDPNAMKAILSILKGETLDQFKANTGRTVTFQTFEARLPVLGFNDSEPVIKGDGTAYIRRLQKQLLVTADGDYGPDTAAAIDGWGFGNGRIANNDVWERAFAMWGATVTRYDVVPGNTRNVTREFFTARLPILKFNDSDSENIDGSGTYYVTRAQRELGITADGDFGPLTQNAVKSRMAAAGVTVDGKTIDLEVWRRLYALYDLRVTGTVTNKATATRR